MRDIPLGHLGMRGLPLGHPWVWEGYPCIYPGYERYTPCIPGYERYTPLGTLLVYIPYYPARYPSWCICPPPVPPRVHQPATMQATVASRHARQGAHAALERAVAQRTVSDERITVLPLDHPFHCWTSVSLSDTRFTVGREEAALGPWRREVEG